MAPLTMRYKESATQTRNAIVRPRISSEAASADN